MRARFYVPSIGRFASADTIVPDAEDPQSFNRYSYAYNNPVKYSDPTGHIACDSQYLPGLDQGACFNDQDEFSTYYPTLSSTASRIIGAGYSENAIPDELAHLDNSDVWDRFFRNVTGFVSEPVDWILTGQEIARGEVSGEVAASMMLFAALPGAQGSLGDDFYRFTDEFDDLVSARSVRYTQDSISAATKGGLYLDDLSGSISYGWSGASLNVVEIEGVYYSLDHRRLAAAQLLDIHVPIRVVDLSDPAIAREFARKSTGLAAGTRGLYMDIRGTGMRIYTDGTIVHD